MKQVITSPVITLFCQMTEKKEFGAVAASRRQLSDWKSWSVVSLFVLFFGILLAFSRLDGQLHLPWLMADNSYYYSILLTSQGERPYVDFQPRYTPGLFYLNAAVFKLFGIHMSVVRWGIGLFWMVDLIGLYMVARFFMPRKFAIVAPVLALLWGPLDRWVPWASWYSIPLSIFSLYFMIRYIKTARTHNFVYAALLGGISFFFKQSTGAYTMIFLLVSYGFFGARREDPRHEGLFQSNEPKSILALRIVCIAFGCLLFPALLIRSNIAARHVFLHLIPIVSLGMFLVAFILLNNRANDNDHSITHTTFGSFCLPLLLAGCAFGGVTILWFPVAAQGIGFVGLTKYLLMLRRPEFISTGSHLNLTPEISAGTFLPTVICLSFVVLGWILFSKKKLSLRLGLASAILIVEIAPFLSRPGLLKYLKSEVLHTSAWMVLTMHIILLSYICANMLSRRRKENLPADLVDLVAVLIFSDFFFLQLFPLNSPSHVLWATNAWFVPAAWIGYRLFRRIPAPDTGRSRAIMHGCSRYAFAVGPILLYFCFSPLFNMAIQFAQFGIMIRQHKIAPPITAVPASTDDSEGKIKFVFRLNKLARPHLDRVDICLRAEFAYGLDYVVGYLKERIGPNDYVFGPNLNFINYAADIPSPLSENYFFPGWVSKSEEVEFMREVDLLKPRYVIFYVATESTDVMSYNRFRIYYPLFAQYLESTYTLEKQIGPFGIARRL